MTHAHLHDFASQRKLLVQRHIRLHNRERSISATHFIKPWNVLSVLCKPSHSITKMPHNNGHMLFFTFGEEFRHWKLRIHVVLVHVSMQNPVVLQRDRAHQSFLSICEWMKGTCSHIDIVSWNHDYFENDLGVKCQKRKKLNTAKSQRASHHTTRSILKAPWIILITNRPQRTNHNFKFRRSEKRLREHHVVDRIISDDLQCRLNVIMHTPLRVQHKIHVVWINTNAHVVRHKMGQQLSVKLGAQHGKEENLQLRRHRSSNQIIMIHKTYLIWSINP